MAVAQKQIGLLTDQLINNAVKNKQVSTQFVRKLISIFVSSVLYQRIDFSDLADHFSTSKFEGIEYKLLKAKTDHPELIEIQKAVEGIIEAFEKEWLKDVCLIIEDKETNRKREVYKLNFNYFVADAQSDTQKMKLLLKKRTVDLLKALEILNCRKSFNRQELSLKIVLMYYDEKTPIHYEPKSFKPLNGNVQQPILELINEQEVKSCLSVVETGHHILESNSNIAIKDFFSVGEQSKEAVAESNKDGEEIILITDESESEEEKAKFKCSCNVLQSISNIGEVCCQQCHTLQHCVCLGFLRVNEALANHTCIDCKEKPSSEILKIKEECNVTRLALAVLYFSESFPEELFNCLSSDSKKTLLFELANLNILVATNKGYFINLQNIESALSFYFTQV